MICVIFLIVLIFKTFALDLSNGKSCITPYGENATCLALGKCNIILSALITDGDRGQRLFKDSQCDCEVGMVCCGTYNNISYIPLIDCAPPPQPERILLSKVSDGSVCGLETCTNKIKGGVALTHGEHPWLAILEYQSKVTNQNAGFRCGGSIITERYILTAAHCVVDVEFMIIKAWLGVTNTSSEEYCQNINGNVRCINTVQKINVRNTIPHEFYNSLDKLNDVGLIQLEEYIQFSIYIRPICLPSSHSELPRIGNYLTVAGWGNTENGETSEIKLKVEVPLQENNICNKFLKKLQNEITSKQLCAGGKRGKDSCEGDSGGPLMYEVVGVNNDVQWFQEGIVSYGNGCGIQGRPGVYTKVSSYDRWIFNKINYWDVYVGNGEPCTTVNNTIGTCVPLTRCEEVSKAISIKHRSATNFAFASRCGNDKYTETLVCCENPGSIIPNLNSTALPDKATCGILKNKPRIAGTEIMDLAEFPWVAGIESFSNDFNATGIRCIGTVINSRYVLTSADCTLMGNFIPLNVWLGHWSTSAYNDCKDTVNCTNQVQKIKIKTSVEHPFNYHCDYDISLFFLESDIIFSDYISPICLPSPNLPKLEPGTLMTVLRLTDEVTSDFITSSDMMLKEEIPLLSNDRCNRILATEEYPLTSPLMCAGREGRHHCYRVYGSPLMRSYEDTPSGRMQWYLEGIVTFLYFECQTAALEQYPGSYTTVSSFLDWIINIISED